MDVEAPSRCSTKSKWTRMCTFDLPQKSRLNSRASLLSMLHRSPHKDEDDAKSPTNNNGNISNELNADSAMIKMAEFHKVLKSALMADRKDLVSRNQRTLQQQTATASPTADGKEKKKGPKARSVQIEIEEYAQNAQDRLVSRNRSLVQMRKYLKFLFNVNKKESSNMEHREQLDRAKRMMDEMERLLSEIKTLTISGKAVLDDRYSCLVYNENLNRLKKEFHGKNKRFKKEIKDRISSLKELQFEGKKSENHYISMRSKMSSILRFSKHNMKAGTMQILKTMLSNVQNMSPPNSDKGAGCQSLHDSVVLELSKQVDICEKLVQKLQDYCCKKQKKLLAVMKEKGFKSAVNGKGAASNESDSNELEEHEYHCDDIIFRVNETGQYEKKFLLVIWSRKSYRVYESEMAFQNGKEPLVEHSFRATDYGYNGHLTVDVKRSSKSKKTSVFKGYQFILAKHAFVVKDMLDIKYWRNYIQRGENMRKISQDWKANTFSPKMPKMSRMSKSQKTPKSIPVNSPYNSDTAAANDENVSGYNHRDRRNRFIRKTRSSSLV